MTSAIILAGGLGTRLRGVVPDLPKPMAPIGGRPFLEYQLDYWINQGVSQFVLSVGYLHGAIVDHFGDRYKGAKLDYVIEKTPLGTGGGFLLAAEKLGKNDPFLLLNGDTYFAVDLKKLMLLLDADKNEYKQRFLVYVGEQIHTVQTSDIAYFYSIEKSSFLTTKGGKSYGIDLSLDKLEKMLSPKDFFRINRQFFISFGSIHKISMLSKSRIKLLLTPLATDETLVSTARTAEFRGWLDR